MKAYWQAKYNIYRINTFDWTSIWENTQFPDFYLVYSRDVVIGPGNLLTIYEVVGEVQRTVLVILKCKVTTSQSNNDHVFAVRTALTLGGFPRKENIYNKEKTFLQAHGRAELLRVPHTC